jgi:hypothetical protein
MFLCNACLSILEMGDTSTFMIKGDARALVIGEGMRDVPAFMIKEGVPSSNTYLLCFHN